MTVAQPSSSARSRRLHPPALPHPVPMPGFSFPQPYPPWRHTYVPRAHFAKGCKNTETATLTTFRINTCKSVSKQRTLTSLRINTYEKHRGGVPQHFHDPGNANSAPSRGFSEMNLPIGVRFHRHVRRVTPLSPVPSLDCAYFPSPRRWYPFTLSLERSGAGEGAIIPGVQAFGPSNVPTLLFTKTCRLFIVSFPSFAHRRPLFSIVCGLFSGNTRGWG